MAKTGDAGRVVPPADAPASGRGLRTFVVKTQLADRTVVEDNLQAVVLCDRYGEPIDFDGLMDALTQIAIGIARLIEIEETRQAGKVVD